MAGEGKICWLCDCKGWAFYNRAKAISRLLPDYEHDIVVLSSDIYFEKYDLIICDFIPWLNFMKDKVVRKSKIIQGLRSFRALEIYEDIARAM